MATSKKGTVMGKDRGQGGGGEERREGGNTPLAFLGCFLW